MKKKEADSQKVIDIYTGKYLNPDALLTLSKEERMDKIFDLYEHALLDKKDLNETIAELNKEKENNESEVEDLKTKVNMLIAVSHENVKLKRQMQTIEEKETERLQKLEDDKNGKILDRISLEPLGFKQWEIHRKKRCIKCESELITVNDLGFDNNPKHRFNAHALEFVCNNPECKNIERYAYVDEHPYKLALKGIIIDYESFQEEENEQEENNDND